MVDTFFSGKFNSIFSFLFGLGFTIQMTRAAERGRDVAPVYLRRVGILFALGVAHNLLVWNGDVLHIYAILGLLLLAFAGDPTRRVCADRAGGSPAGRTVPYSAITKEPWPIAEKACSTLHGRDAHLPERHLHRTGELPLPADRGGRRLHQAVRGYVMFYFSLAITLLFGFYVGRRRIIRIFHCMPPGSSE